jgi:hypothetical protein
MRAIPSSLFGSLDILAIIIGSSTTKSRKPSEPKRATNEIGPSLFIGVGANSATTFFDNKGNPVQPRSKHLTRTLCDEAATSQAPRSAHLTKTFEISLFVMADTRNGRSAGILPIVPRARSSVRY